MMQLLYNWSLNKGFLSTFFADKTMFVTAIFNFQLLVTRKQEAKGDKRRAFFWQTVSSSSIYYFGKIWVWHVLAFCVTAITPFPNCFPVYMREYKFKTEETGTLAEFLGDKASC